MGQKSYEELAFRDDFMFCKILGQDKQLCKEILELILERKIKDIRYPETQKQIEITSDGKGIRLDVYAEDEEDNVYDVEMQTVGNKNLPKRSRYYQGMIDLNLIERGADYKKLKKSFIIFICTFDAFGKGLHKYTFENACREEPSLTLQDESVKIFLCTEGVKNDVSEQLLMFLRYVAGAKPEGELPERIEERVGRARSREEWRREYMTQQMRDLENQEIGIELGKEIGIELGKEIGVGLGEKARAVKTAQTMLEQQEPLEKIVLYTGLSREEIEELAGKRTSI
ncbi:MAG: Rpn family recombination-promoting nuclease/putative transposase [Lachnospiraceae bacterium]|nr:Rpn family recombination-promoting nuclease/putative transposase [Lachnospiraceae bacterium]